MVVGPFDKRIAGKRCLECRKRHLKCEGFNCRACHQAQRVCMISSCPKPFIKLNKSVVYAATKRNSNEHLQEKGKHKQSLIIAFSDIPTTLETNPVTLLIGRFYTSFLGMNSFTGRPGSASDTLQIFLHSSPALSNVAMAIGSMFSEGTQDSCDIASQAQPIQFYRKAVSSLQKDLQDQHLSVNYSVLWSTFFLGLFELMYDATGDGWIRHFLYGTSELLNYFGPAALTSGAGREFFITIRVFEISRALLFTQETFLSRPKWKLLMEGLWIDRQFQDWHPKEALFDIIISCSTLGVLSTELMTRLPHLALKDRLLELHTKASEGLALQNSLQDWRDSVQHWTVPNDDQMTLALIYYSATSIYLSGIFDYFNHWDEYDIQTPTINSFEVQENVQNIITLVNTSLSSCKLAGLLFLFPLRIAGARVEMEQEIEILRLLGEISKRGFIVANTIAAELRHYWSIVNSDSSSTPVYI